MHERFVPDVEEGEVVMGLWSSDKPAVTREQRAKAIKAQKRDEKFEKQMKERQRMERDRARGRSKGWW